MSDFGDISRMDLSKLGEKDPETDSVDAGADTEDIEVTTDPDMEHAGSPADVHGETAEYI